MNSDCGFEERERTLFDTWSGEVLTSKKWQLVQPVGFGVTEPWLADSSDGIRAIVKKADLVLATQTVWAGAHEKIAADLAHEVGVCVAPVVLWKTPDGNARFAISARAFAQYEHWETAQELGLVSADVLEALLPALAAGYVFHNWIGDTDHNGSDQNLVFSTTDAAASKPAIAFVDHSRSMSQRWKRDGRLDVLQNSYYVAPEQLPLILQQAALNRILSLSSARIDEVVHRVPEDFLPSPIRDIICRCLKSRKSELKNLVMGLG